MSIFLPVGAANALALHLENDVALVAEVQPLLHEARFDAISIHEQSQQLMNLVQTSGALIGFSPSWPMGGIVKPLLMARSEKPSGPKSGRGLSTSPDPDADIKRKLTQQWAMKPQNRPLERGWSAAQKTVDDLNTVPQTLRMAKALVEARAGELRRPVDQVRVIVPGHGGQVMEALIWLETGAQVTVTEAGSIVSDRSRQWVNIYPQHRKYWKRLTISQPGEVPPGDIVAWSHPSKPASGTFWPAKPEELMGYGKGDAWMIVQSDYIKQTILPFEKWGHRFRLIFHDANINAEHYFFPSPQVRRNWTSGLLILKGQMSPGDTALVTYQKPTSPWLKILSLPLRILRNVLWGFNPKNWR